MSGKPGLLFAIACAAIGTATVAETKADVTVASEPTKLAVQLLALFDMDQMMAGMEQQMAGLLKTQFDGFVKCEASQPVVDAAAREISELFTREFHSDSYLPEIAQLYTDVFTVEELQAMLDFYRSPLGEKILARTPELMQQSMQIVERQMTAAAPLMEAVTDKLGRELAAARKLCEQASSDE